MKKWIIIIISSAIVALLGILVFMKFPIVSGNHTTVVIHKKNHYESRIEITNKVEIEKIKDAINNSPRRFRGLIPQMDYDHGEFGYIVFTDNNSRSKKLSIYVYSGNVITRYWDIDTDFFSSANKNNMTGRIITKEEKTKNPDADEILRLFGDDADFFMFNGIIYLTNIDWVEQLPLTKDKQVGEITSQNSSNTDFENRMSNKLPIGTKIYSSKERSDILIVEKDNQVLKYYAIVEG